MFCDPILFIRFVAGRSVKRGRSAKKDVEIERGVKRSKRNLLFTGFV